MLQLVAAFNREHILFRAYPLTREHLTGWYHHRACEIEELSSQVNYALELVCLGQEKQVQVS